MAKPRKSSLFITSCGMIIITVLLLGLAAQMAFATPTVLPPHEWVDQKTGHRVVCLSRRPGPNFTFYFHQNAFTESGDKMMFIGQTPAGRSAFTVNMTTLEITPVTPGKSIAFEVLEPKRGVLYYLDGHILYETQIDTLKTRRIRALPSYYRSGRGFSINADATQLLGCYAEGESEYYKLPREEWFTKIYEAKLPNTLYTIDTRTGRIKEVYQENNWLGHPQFSPVNPEQLLFCHEGPERQLHRMWLMCTEDDQPTKLFPSSTYNTFVTHEFWDPDGEHVWFDLQYPRWFVRHQYMDPVAWCITPLTYIAKTNIKTGETFKYELDRRHYSWHYNISNDGSMLCGDGEGRYFELTLSGKWINLYRPNANKMKVERLVNLKNNSYNYAPNARFTPNGQWVVFTADIHGTPQVYAVEVVKAD